MKFIFTILTSVILLFSFHSTHAQSNFWSETDETHSAFRSLAEKDIHPEEYRTFSLDYIAMESALQNAPEEFTRRGRNNPLEVMLPDPDGNMITFELVKSQIMEQGLADKFPEIVTLSGRSTDGKYSGRFDWTIHGFHGFVFYPDGSYYINPYNRETVEQYIVFKVENNFSKENSFPMECGVSGDEHDIREYTDMLHQGGFSENRSSEETQSLLTYRIAVVATGQYTQFFGGSVQQGLSAVVTGINRVNNIFETDLGVRFLLVENNDEIIFTDPQTDGYEDGNTSQMIVHNQQVLDDIIGNANYDIGHVFGVHPQNLGGLASLFSLCNPNSKGRGVSTHVFPANDPFIVSIVCHELGHQFGARHTMYSCQNVNPETAYEPGGGTTIMAYAGICPNPNNIQSNADPMFHVNSIEVMRAFSRTGNGNSCAVELPTDNIPPVVELTYENGFHIPILTPFKLEGFATDLNDDELTYSWEQYDIGPTLDPYPNLGTSVGDSPLFRVFPPVDVPHRYFPRLSDLVNNRSQPFELLPDTTRNLTFRLIVRDNNPESGAVDWEQVRFRSAANAGPFVVEYPNERDTFRVGELVEVRWDVANTDLPPVNSQRVDILLSNDRGFNYPITLTEGAFNTGSAMVQIPNTAGNLNRIKVRAADNIFFDISDVNFIIQEAEAPLLLVNHDAYPGTICAPQNNLVFDLWTEAVQGYADTLQFEWLSELPEGAEILSVPDQIIPGESYQIELDFSNTFVSGDFDLDFRLTSEQGDTINRTVFFDIVPSDFRAFDINFPLDGASGVNEVASYRWVGIPDAVGYEIEISENPSFSEETIVYSNTVFDSDSVRIDVILESNSIYFWRVRPFNDCGFGPFSEVAAFQTRTRDCVAFEPFDLPQNIAGSTGSSAESVINLTFSGEVTEIIIPNIMGTQSSVGDLAAYLISPSGTEVELFNRVCRFWANYNLGLNDNAPGEISCPSVNSGNQFIPQEPLSTFVGEPIQGEWKLRILRVSNEGGGFGNFQNWSLELCSDVSLRDLNLLRNDTLFLKPLDMKAVNRQVLRADETDNEAENLVFTLVTVPSRGSLLLNGNEMTVGSTFTQADINSERLIYNSLFELDEIDEFRFVVSDGQGGWLGTETFNIVVDQTVSVSELDIVDPSQLLSVFPNPASSYVQYALKGWEGQTVQLVVVAVDGKVVKRQRVVMGEFNVLDLDGMSSGIYFLGLTGEKGQASQKFVIE